MGRPRGSMRDAFTPSGEHRQPLARTFTGQDVPAFQAKPRTPPYLDPRVRGQQKGPDGDA